MSIQYICICEEKLIVLGFNDTSTLVGHFTVDVVSQRKGEKR